MNRSHPMLRPALWGGFLALAMAGCRTPSLPPPPEPTLPATPTTAAAPVEWPTPADVSGESTNDFAEWTWGDAQLAGLLGQIEQNPEVAVAGQRVAEALALLGAAGGARQPTVNATVTASRTFNSRRLERGTPRETDRFSPGLSVGWEADLGGTLRAAQAAAQSNVDERAEAQWEVRRLLAAALVQAYWQWQGIEAEVAVLRATANLRREALALLEARVASGLATDLPAAQERLNLAQLAAEMEVLRAPAETLRQTIAVLIGRPPGAVELTVVPLPVPPAAIPAVDSKVLAARPDLRAAAMRLATRYAELQQARGAFFPRLTLTGSLGFSAAEWADLFDVGARTASLAGGLTQPLFDGRRNRSNYEAAQARLAAAEADWKRLVLAALQEVEGALAERRAIARQRAASQAVREAATATRTLAETRFERGFETYLAVLEGQRAELAAQRTLVQLQRAEVLAMAKLDAATARGAEFYISLAPTESGQK